VLFKNGLKKDLIANRKMSEKKSVVPNKNQKPKYKKMTKKTISHQIREKKMLDKGLTVVHQQ